MTAAAIERPQPFRDAGGTGSIVFDPARLRQAEAALFDPGAHGPRATPVAAGGRGAAWFVDGAFGQAVLRHYRRGGWMARLSSDGFLWQGERRVRSLREYALTRQLHAAGLPVPPPLAAMYRRSGLAYRAAILVQRITGARPFADLVLADRERAPWAEAGALVARFHRAGAHHADLNVHNLLVDSQGALWLIDWDKGRLERGPGAWCDGVVARLERSLRKQCGGLPAAVLDEGMRRLRAAHDRELAA